MLELPDLALCSWLLFLFVTFVGSLCVRIINSIWKCFESQTPSKEKFIGTFLGSGWEVIEETLDQRTGEAKEVKRREQDDYWQPFVLGWLELIAYPILIFSDKPSFIGAWLAFKTVHKWSYSPETKRGFYNRYLVSNLLILIVSFVLVRLLF